MYDFYYNYITNKNDDKATSSFTETNSSMYATFYENFYNSKELFDFSKY